MINILIFLSAYVAGFIHTLAGNPATAFMLYQFVYFMYPQGRWWGGSIPAISYSFFTVLLMLGMFAIGFAKHNKNSFFAVPQFKWVFLVCFLFGIAGFYAVLPAAHSLAATYFAKLILIVSIAYKIVDTKKTLNGILYAYVAGAAYIGFLTYQSGRNRGNRVEGIGTVDSPDSNGIAVAIAPTLVITLYYFWVTKAKNVRFCMLVAGVFIANALVLINSRGAFLAAIVGCAYFLWNLFFSEQQRKNQKKNTILLVMLALLGAGLILDESAIKRFKSMGNTEIQTEGGVEQETGATRLYFWIASVEMANDFPFGLGYKSFEAKAPDYIPQDVDTGSTRNRSVHSTWFQTLTEIGYPGLFCFIAMLLSCFKATKTCKKALLAERDFEDFFKIVAIESALLSYMVGMSFMNRMTSEILYWLVLFTACAYNVYILKPQEETKNTEFATVS